MKKLMFLLILFVTNVLIAQNNTKCVYTLTVINNQSQPISNIPVTLIETTSKKRIVKNTNSNGKITFEIKEGLEWAINILEMKNCSFIELSENGISEGSETITYDVKNYERKNRELIDRNQITLITEDQTKIHKPNYNKSQAAVQLKIVKEDGNGLPFFPVNLTCYKIGKTFFGKTDSNGIAYFLVPEKNDYEVDIDGIESFNYVDVKRSGQYSLKTTYQPTNIKETEVNDTIKQIITNDSKGSTNRVYLKLNVKQLDIKKLGNEDVYLQMLKTNKVYRAKTNSKGEAYFLLPAKRKYMVHFRYQKDIDVLNFMDMQGIASAEGTFIYSPNPRLQFPEKYIPTPQDLLVKNFIEFITKQFPEPINDEAIAMTLNWGNETINENSKEAVLQIGFKAKNDTGGVFGPPLNISLVIDKSGSMEGHDRIDALKTSLLKYVSKLRQSDIVSLVVFNDNSTIVVPAQKVGDGSYLRDMIEDIKAGGGTDIYKGMVDGYEQVLKNFIPNGTNRVLLLTDGYGITSPDIMVSKSTEYNKKGIELSAIGVGTDYNQSLLSMLATVGGGLLNFVGDSKDINGVFEKELSSVLSPCAKDLSVEIIHNDKIIFKQLYGYPFQKIGNKNVIMNINNAYSGLNTLALVKFDLNKPDKFIENSPVIVRMNYYDFKKQKKVTTEEKAFLKWMPSTGKLELILEAQHKKLYAIAILNQSLKVMAEAFYKKDYNTALLEIQNTINQVKNLYPNSNDNDVEELVNAAANYSLGLTTVIRNMKPKS
jgi:hypothetical protein